MRSETDGARLFGLILVAVIAVWVMIDAMRRGRSSGEALLWGIGVFCLCCVFMPAYLIGRAGDDPMGNNPRETTLCRYCGLYNEGDPTYCSHCDKQLKGVGDPNS